MTERDNGLLADFGGIDHTVNHVCTMNDRTLDFRLQKGSVGHACGQRHTGGAHEGFIDAHRTERFNRGQTDERVGCRAIDAAKRDNVEIIVFGGLAERTKRMSDDGDALFGDQKTQQTQCRCAGINKNGVAVGNFFRSQTTDERFVNRIESGTNGCRHSTRGDGGGNAAVYLCDMSALLKLVQIAADSVLGNTENLA